MSIKTGILLPRSDMFSTLALDFLNGFRLGLSLRGNTLDGPEIVVESIGNATGETVLRTAEKMILQENTDLTISFCSIFDLHEMVATYTAYKKNLIHLDLGGNVIGQEHVSPYVLHHTLNLWQSAYRIGEYAAKNMGKSAAIATSYYDGGYHLVESFVRGFTSGGGNIVFPYVAPFDYKSESYENLVEGLERTQPDFVFSLFSYKEEQKVLNILSERLSKKSLPVIWSPLIDLDYGITRDYELENVISLSSWDFESKESEMQHFIQTFQKKYNAAPNVFSLLGYESGLTVSHSLDEHGNLPPQLGTFSEKLKFEGPRGDLSFNSFHESQTPGYFLRQYDFTKKPYQRTDIQHIELNGEEKLYDQFKDLPASGWKNPYIIT